MRLYVRTKRAESRNRVSRGKNNDGRRPLTTKAITATLWPLLLLIKQTTLAFITAVSSSYKGVLIAVEKRKFFSVLEGQTLSICVSPAARLLTSCRQHLDFV